VASIFVVLAPALLLVTSDSTGVPEFLKAVSLALLLMSGWLWVRLPFTGARIVGDQVIVTSWWSRKELSLRDVARFRAEPYEGPFYYLAWSVDYGIFASAQLEAELKDGSRVKLPGTVSSRRAVNEIARSLDAQVGAAVASGATPHERLRDGRRTRSGWRMWRL
jgi:hypothetical protein